MSDQRTKDTIQRLAHKRPGVVKLAEAVDPAPILTKTGLGSVARGTAGAGSIASPLTEQSRTYHATKVTSSDGLFTWAMPETVTMLDANGMTVEFIYAAPT